MIRWWLILGAGCLFIPAATAEDRSATIATPTHYTKADLQKLSQGYTGYCPPVTSASQPQKDQQSAGPPAILKAAYAPDRQRTFFLYRGRLGDNNRPILMMSFYDHQLKKLARPRPIHPSCRIDRETYADFVLDDDEYMWVFVGSDKKGGGRIYKSALPFSNAGFFPVKKLTFARPEIIYKKEQGFLLFHTLPGHQNASGIFVSRSSDGLQWGKTRMLADIGAGHFYHAAVGENRVGLVFNYWPEKGGRNLRTNLYYIQSHDFGRTWQTPDGHIFEEPLRQKDNPALIRDYESMKRVAFIKDITFDDYDNPVILYLSALGPEFEGRKIRRTWYTARWFRGWRVSGLITSDDNRDNGSLFLEAGNKWRIIAPTSPAGKKNVPGGEVVMWMSRDAGRSWWRTTLTPEAEYNHNNVCRPLNANEDCYAFWADDACESSNGSNLYFGTQQGRVFRLPHRMKKPFVYPETYDKEKSE